MKKYLGWISENLLYIYTLVLLAFIPLYPKIPLLDLKNTWVSIRGDDLFIAIGVILFCIQLLRRKVTFKTPLTIPIGVFWLVGLISTIIAIVFIFPTIADVFPNLAILHYLRRIEYLIVFFIAFASIKTKKQLYGVIGVLVATLLAVVLYGLGQRYFGFYAFLTMNEEFAKGTPLRLSALSRVPSTFAGHYDLAAYLVMMISIMVGLITGFKNIAAKILFLLVSVAGLTLLLMTASRVSFAVYLVTIMFLLVLQKKKLFIIPAIILSIVFSTLFEGMTDRFASTISQADVIVDARTGQAIGIAKEEQGEGGEKRIVIEDKQSTGENLPQGSGFINIPSKGTETETELVYKRSGVRSGDEEEGATTLKGEFVVKKVLAYDVSFTTRIQGTWPRALEAFKRNFLTGSGYSSISLASDGNYLRILGEVGSLGFLAFISIFMVYAIYVYRLLPEVKSRVTKHFILGVTAGIFGLGLNAVLIDVFEASKVAYILWTLMGISLAFLMLSTDSKVPVLKDITSILKSWPAIFVMFIVGSIVLYWSVLSHFFIGDDFTWLRWAADCSQAFPQLGGNCPSIGARFSEYFMDSQNFFYRPGTKIYFYSMYSLFWLSPVMYHLASVLLHATIAFMLYLIARPILKSQLFAAILAVLFISLSALYEAVFWISVSGHLISIALVIGSLLFFKFWIEYKRLVFICVSFVMVVLAPFFHEYAVVAPVLLITYSLLAFNKTDTKEIIKKWYAAIPFILIIPIYLSMRFFAESAGFSGDYNYNLVKLPVNMIGNLFGYIAYAFVGTPALPVYATIRENLKDNLMMVTGAAGVAGVILAVVGYKLLKKMNSTTVRHVLFGLVFFVISMLPFLGLGNIAERYIYFGIFGLLLLAVMALQAMYVRVKKVSPKGAATMLTVVLLAFIGYQITQIKKLEQDWKHASTITGTMVKDFGYFALQNIEIQEPVYFFVNVPIRTGSAWVFPVGLEDALWFTTQNQTLTVHRVTDLDEAVTAAESIPDARVFEFDKDGNLDALVKTVVPVNE